MRIALLVMGLFGLLTVACDPVYTIEVDIEVPVEAQRANAALFPAEVLLNEGAATCAYRVGVICAIDDAPFAAQWSGGGICGTERGIEVWMSPLAPDEVGPQDCGAVPEDQQVCASAPALEGDLPMASALAFEGTDPSDCAEGTDHLTLRLDD